MTEKIAIIGGGIAGLTAAYLLNQKYDITLFEKDNRIGGNAYTHQTKDGEMLDIAVGAYHRMNSGNFFKLLSELNVKLVRQLASSFLSIHDMEKNAGVYLTPLNLKGLHAQKFAILRPPLKKSLDNLVIYTGKLFEKLDNGRLKNLTLRDAFKLTPLTESEIEIILAPLCLLSSMYFEEVMNGPAEFFIKKLQLFGRFRPEIQSVGLHFPKYFTKSYVDALGSHFSDKTVLNSTIKRISRNGKVVLKNEDGSQNKFDKIVFACNADQALSMLEDPTDEEKRLLGAWRYKEGLMVVHTDDTYFPKRELCQSWTCLRSTRKNMAHFSISLCCWRFSPAVSPNSRYLGTQHPNFKIKEELIDFKKVFRTPIYDFESFATIKEMPTLNGQKNSYYCGSHFGLGLHNDAVSSAINVARRLGIEWEDFDFYF